MVDILENKRAWIMIVEAFIGIVLIAGVLVIALGSANLKTGDPYEKIYSVENGILEDIQMNDNLRTLVINTPVPSSWDESTFPQQLKNSINELKPNYLNCSAKICEMNSVCEMSGLPKKDIYAESSVITTTFTDYNPKKLKLFCWEIN